MHISYCEQLYSHALCLYQSAVTLQPFTVESLCQCAKLLSFSVTVVQVTAYMGCILLELGKGDEGGDTNF